MTSHNANGICIARFSNVSVTGGSGVWSNQDIGIKTNTRQPLYVTLQDSGLSTAVVHHEADPNAVQQGTWQEWNIDIKSFAGINLNAVKKMIIGTGKRSAPQPGSAGTVYFDDIRLYQPRYIPGKGTPLTADITLNGVVNNEDLAIIARDWLLTDSTIATSAPVDPNMVVRYEFEDNLYDSASYAGYQNGDPCGSITYNTGTVGNRALSLSGGPCANFGNPTALDFWTTNWSVCAWIKTTQSDTGDANKGSIFGKGGDATGGIRYTLGVGEVTEGKVTLATDDDVTKVQATSTTSINNNVWHHVVGLRDGTTLRLYVDGFLEGTATLPAGYNLAGTSQHNAYVGTITNHSNSTLYKFYRGLIDDVRVYNYALSNAEIAYLATRGRRSDVCPAAVACQHL